MEERKPHSAEERNARTCRVIECEISEQDWQEHLANEAALQQSFEDAKAIRIANAFAEREAWREERRRARVQEWVEAHPGRDASMYPWGGIARHG